MGRKVSDQTNRTLDSLFWMMSSKGFDYIISLVITVVLARLLTPEEFGTVAAAMLVIKFSETFSMMGIGPALIQRQTLTIAHVRTGFTLSLLLGAVFFTAVWFLAPLISTFFQIDNFIPVLRTLVFIFPIHSISMVAESLLARELKFKHVANIELFSTAFGYGLGSVALALSGFGVWSIVFGTLMGTSLKSILVLIAQKHPKRPLWDKEAAKNLMSFGGGMTITGLSGYFARQGDNLVIGWGLGAQALGVYGRAYNLISMPVNMIGKVLDQVLFPAMAAVQEDSKRLQSAYKIGLSSTALLTLPLSAILLILAPEIIMVLLGPNWMGVVRPFQILAFAVYFRTAYKISASLARAVGAIYRQAWLQTVYALLVVVGSLIGLHWGVSGVAVGALMAVTIHYLLMLHMTSKLMSIRGKDLANLLRPSFLLTLCLTLPLQFVVWQLREDHVTPITILIVSMGFTCGLLLLLLRLQPMVFLGFEGIWLTKAILAKWGQRIPSLQKILIYILGKRFADAISV